MSKVKLSEFAAIVMGQSPQGETCNEIGNGVALLNGPSEFTDFYPAPKQYTTDPKKYSTKDSILFCVRGSTTGRMNWSDKEYAIGRGLASLSHKSGSHLNHFLRYIIQSNLSCILKTTSGSTFPNLTSDLLASFEFEIPDLPTQKKISSVLSALDSKIELNNRINSELEQMAKTIYDYWFVQFDFPISPEYTASVGQPELEGKPYRSSGGKMVWSEELKREVPEGWEVKKLENVINKIIDNRGKTPLKLGGDWSQDSQGVIALSAKHVKDGKLIKLEDANVVTFEMFEKWMPNKLEYGDILMTSEAPCGEFYMILNDTNYCLSQRLFAMRAENSKVYPSYLYYELAKGNGYSQIIGKQSGSTVFGIRQDELRTVNILVPNLALQRLFDEKVKPMLLQIRTNEAQSRKLTELRDWLLPMLMNGQVRVGHVDEEGVVGMAEDAVGAYIK